MIVSGFFTEKLVVAVLFLRFLFKNRDLYLWYNNCILFSYYV